MSWPTRLFHYAPVGALPRDVRPADLKDDPREVSVIAIVCSASRERSALLSLCEFQGWNAVECDSVRAAVRLLARVTPRVVLVRSQLDDGFSDDVIAAAGLTCSRTLPRIVVLMHAGASSAHEARQLELGADCIQRDPVRTDVLLAYLAKYLLQPAVPKVEAKTENRVAFAGAVLSPLERTVKLDSRHINLTPREVRLAELLAAANGDIVTYESLYSDILGRRFRGDTSNMRVLLAKLCNSMQSLGVDLRKLIDVIPKAGYRLRTNEPRSALKARHSPRRK